MSGLDLSTANGALRFCELRRAEMVSCWQRLGRYEANGHMFGAFAFMTHEVTAPPDSGPSGWKTGSKLGGVKAVELRLPRWALALEANQAKDVYSGALRSYAKLGRAVGTVFMTEMWMVSVRVPEGTVDPEAEAQRQRDDMPDNLEDAPGRREGLCLWLEHSAAGSVQWMAEIHRDPTRLDAWQERRLAGVKGRFVGLVDVRN